MKKELTSDVVIIGLGPSGLKAVSSAVKSNLAPIVFEWDEQIGGILRLMGKEISTPKDVEVYTKTTVINVVYNPRGSHKIIAVKKGEIIIVNTKRIVFATGSRDITTAGARITGDRPSGVFTATEALRLLSKGYIFGKKIAILGGNEISIFLSKLLASKNFDVTLITPRKVLDIPGVKIIHEHTVTHIKGKERIEKVKLALSNEDFIPIKDDREYECDTFIISIGFRPLIGLLNKLPITIDMYTKGPVVNEAFEALPGIYVIGGALAPFELLRNVEKSGNLVFKKSNVQEGLITIKPGNNVKFIVPHRITEKKPFTLFYSVKPYFRKLKIMEENIEISINEEESFVEIDPSSFKTSRITIDAMM
ncbi:MAG: NAD(P)/FAD-dependent oxidoreductase [Thermoprotei archaeon]|jgi:pyruvate/2-oxoglutarate dehydrogenase complex dihydrolipoamide dehydrogenase (E3) component